MKHSSTVSDCTCTGINIINDMTDFYTDEVRRHVRGEPRSKLLYKRAKDISDRLYNHLTKPERDIKYGVTDRIKKEYDLNYYRSGCEDGIGYMCITELELLRQEIHNVSSAREKLVCTENIEYHESTHLRESPLADNVRILMGKLSRGEFIDPDTGDLYFDPRPDNIIDLIKMCKKQDGTQAKM